MQLIADGLEDEPPNPALEVDVIAQVLSSNRRRKWFDLCGQGEMYLRRSRLLLAEEEREGLVIANIRVKENCQRKGVFSNAVAVVEEAVAHMGLSYVFVEVIVNPVLIPALEKRSYTIRRTKNGPIDLDGRVLPASRDVIDAYKLLSEARSV
ncbi:hypothetical protein [Burkholderia diffusa]|uniref:hypothetical protein n=1 Tax=Burkholderia diffusa TaxID=488732 RepID=UPI0012465840|nr:hypothetical protein [Burkholderia diffusa]KAB0657138.1 hypothetical protein F7R23_12125 [Burkholderia diffusa]MBM2655015.1 hypothetical protein [Burkholderia diffusa]